MIKNLIRVASILLILSINTVKGEKFIIGDYIDGMYVKMQDSEHQKYLTVQFIQSEYGDITYCIEPFILLNQTIDYEELTTNIEQTINLTKQDLEIVKLIAYYGYGYTNREEPYWYAITQAMIWQYVSPNATIYFTDTLNGNQTHNYDNYINEIINDVTKDLEVLDLPDYYEVNYLDNLIIDNIPNNINVTSKKYTITRNNNQVIVNNVIRSSSITFQKINDYYNEESKVYVGSSSQKLIKRGNLTRDKQIVNVNCLQATLNINIIDDLYIPNYNEDFNLIFTLSNNNNIFETVNMSNKDYRIHPLPFGTYYLDIIDLRGEYTLNKTHYEFTIDSSNNPYTQEIILNKKYNTLNIYDYLCTNEDCILAPNINISIYDDNTLLIKELDTDENGYTNILLPYGTYYIYQEQLEDYDLLDTIKVVIDNNDEQIIVELYNKRVIKEEPPIEDIPLEIEPPETGINDYHIIFLFSSLLIIIVKSLKKI